MKKLLLSISMAAFAMSAAAQTVYFEEDFEWIAPYATAGKAGDTIGSKTGKDENGADVNAPNMNSCKVDDVNLYKAMQNKGYEFLATHSDIDKKGDAVEARTPQKQIYVQSNYLKFGLTNYFSGITFPAIEAFGEGASDVEISFDWCTMKQGSGIFDTTELVVVVANGENEQQFKVDPLEIADGSEFKWYPAKVSLKGATLNKTSRISIRNADSQWPGQAEKGGNNLTYRYFLDNIKVYAADGSGVAAIEADGNAPVEYYNLQGVRVANPENGLYIVKQGNKVSKKVIK